MGMHRSAWIRASYSSMNMDDLAGPILSLAETLLSEAGREETQSIPALTTPFSNTTQADWAEAVQLWNEHGRTLISGLEPRDCPACGQNNKRELFVSYDGYPFVECCTCGCWYVPL